MTAVEALEPGELNGGRLGPGSTLCLVCGERAAAPFLDLGSTALANNLPVHPEASPPDPLFPLRVGFCPVCHHVQLLELTAPQAMFDEYLYVSSASSTLSAHFVDLAEAVQRRIAPGPADLCVDIGSNDGSLLAALAAVSGARVRGVDPAANLAGLARARGVETEVAYFKAETATRVRSSLGEAQLITATNSFPHIPDLDGYLNGVETLLARDGVFVIEAHYLGDMIEQNAFDTIYHEHASYWALGPLERILGRHGLEVFDAERLPIHHGQLRVWVARRGRRPIEPAVERLRLAEAAAGLGRLATFEAFALRVAALRVQLRECLSGLRARGQRVAGYGAPAKASTLLAYCGFGPRDIAWIADRNRLKQGRATPGTRIPIVAPGQIELERPDVLVLFAWNFAAEIGLQLAEYRRGGLRLLVPVPAVQLV